MAKIPVDEVIAHLHGVGTEYTGAGAGAATKHVTGGGAATLDITRRADGEVSVYIAFMFRGFEFRVPQQEWDRVMAGKPPGYFEVARAVREAWTEIVHKSGYRLPERVIEDLGVRVAMLLGSKS